MPEIQVTLPDGSLKIFPEPVSPLGVAQAISKRLAEEAIVAKVNGDLWDLERPLEGDAKVEILTPKSEDPDALYVYRHSTAHLLAAAVLELWPETKLGIGPPIENGLYYDFDKPTPFSTEDLEKIEARMRELASQDLRFERRVVEKEAGLAKYRAMDEPMKCELIEERAGETFTEYTLGPHFIDFCRGPHVPTTRRLKAFKLLSVAGAYWKGNEKNKQLQRIYATAWFTDKDLKEHLDRLEEAKRRDHRKLGAELGYISVQELAGPGLIFWHEKGGLIRKELEDWMRDQYLKRGYALVFTPHIVRKKLFEVSGHEEHYVENMFDEMELDDAIYRVRPMNCPGHILIYSHGQKSYRDLPVRLGELGTVHRYEKSGVLHGLLRVRGFCQDDAHIFCRPDQLVDEMVACLDFAIDVLRTFGFEKYEAELSTWDGGVSGKYDGTPEQWKMAEEALSQACDRVGLKAKLMPDEGAFYGAKIDVKLVDAIGRKWQLSTVQFDFNLPRRFGITYIGEDGQKHQPVMVHRALFGSVERFFGILLEHYAGSLPVWLSPVQATVMPITDRTAAFARKVHETLLAAGIRSHLDERPEKVNLKIREAQLQKVPYMLVVGDREAEAGTVSLRNRRAGDLGAKPVDEVLAMLRKLIDEKTPVE